MAELVFFHGTMTSGKTTSLLQDAHNYRANGHTPLLLTAAIDSRSGAGVIRSRIGIASPAETYTNEENLYEKVRAFADRGRLVAVLVDEAQWLSRDQVFQLSDIVDELGIGVSAYGLKVDFKGDLFPGSAALMALADRLHEITGICRSGAKATMVARLGPDGLATLNGPQVLVGGEETYVALSRREWKAAVAEGQSARRAGLALVSNNASRGA